MTLKFKSSNINNSHIKSESVYYALTILAIFFFFHGMLGFFLVIYLKQLNYLGWQIGLLLSLVIIIGIVSSFIIGKTCDDLPTKYLTITGAFFYIIFFLGLYLNLSFYQNILVFAIGGLGRKLLTNSIQTMNLKSIIKNRGFGFGLLTAAEAIPVALGLMAGGIFIQIFNFKSLFLLNTFSMSLVFIMCWFLPKTQAEKQKIIDYKIDIFRKEVFIFIGIIMLFSIHHGVETSSYALFLKNNLTLNMYQIGFFTGFPVIFLGITSIIFGKMFDKLKVSMKTIILYSLLISGLGLIGFVSVNNYYISLLLRTIHEIGDGGFGLFMYFGLGSLFPNSRIGGNLGIVYTLKILTAGVSTYLFSIIECVDFLT